MTLALMYVMAVVSLVATPDQVRGVATKVFIYSGAAIVHNVLTEKHFFNAICASFPLGFAAFLLVLGYVGRANILKIQAKKWNENLIA
ncbi:hypothetical protein ACH5RR_009530 [Cinchona calisaya]|uniref:Uncharacterized protein n=1 Tax=Cinchona calisaya TaxID=153742 RepID=A0ABD3AIF9_9GENT